ncbi:hypothetical protein IFM89_001332 [Coptis chinensis]|uniref:Uncharacterized protein n=1 Tax=Coptis chinensis TaxID=261450 RepID=A0A835GWB8_9MAGN|nr:hypothetical protein IFM89_001332 [Coptis chinensis]
MSLGKLLYIVRASKMHSKRCRYRVRTDLRSTDDSEELPIEMALSSKRNSWWGGTVHNTIFGPVVGDTPQAASVLGESFGDTQVDSVENVGGLGEPSGVVDDTTPSPLQWSIHGSKLPIC